jgi:hypothetical protein
VLTDSRYQPQNAPDDYDWFAGRDSNNNGRLVAAAKKGPGSDHFLQWQMFWLDRTQSIWKSGQGALWNDKQWEEQHVSVWKDYLAATATLAPPAV